MSQSYQPPEVSSRHSARGQFYRELPALLAPAFPGIEAPQLRELTVSAVRYFQFALYLDDLIDGDIIIGPSTRPGLLAALTLHEQSIKGLATLFPQGHPFWLSFDQCRQAFDQAQHSPAADEQPQWTRESFEALAVAKSAMSEVVAYALHSMSTPSDTGHQKLAAVLDCLRWYHTASEYEDNIVDFRKDWEQQQLTYTHAQVLAYLAKSGIGHDTRPTAVQLQQYLYTSGIAGQVLGCAEHYYRRVTTQAQLLGLTTLATLAVQQTSSNVELQQQIRQQISQATARVQATLQEQAAQPADVADRP